MFDISADVHNNKLYITLEGTISDNEIKEAVFKTLYELNKLRPGFDIIKNLRGVNLISESARVSFSRAIEIANSYGLNNIYHSSDNTFINQAVA